MKTAQLKSLFHDFVCAWIKHYPTTHEEQEKFDNDYNTILKLINECEKQVRGGVRK